MRRTGVFAMALISVVLVGATAVSYSKYRKSVAQYAQATVDQQNMQQRYDRAVTEIVTIQDSLNAIVLGEDAAKMIPASRQAEAQLPGTLHDQVLSRISTLKEAIERTKERIEALDAKLKRSGVRIAGLERMIGGLRKSVAEKEQRIAELGTQVDTLQTRVAGLNVEVENQQLDIIEKQHELATIFYTMGTKKDLTRSGVVAAKGGVLGIGKTLEPSGHFSDAAFTPLDTDQENVIRIPSDKAEVLSAQPLTSYVLQPIGKDMVELHILDPKEFRKIKHLVILMT